ncbi:MULTISPECIES: DUF2726 domain-containing protein [Pseudomonadota]|uniref:DUF2726 domain-containing protein n=1 Tax=Pseudomonadota TaxID=1224 RepID=UPI001D0F1DDD|nr:MULTISPECIES: DUF2726 domain-containing protein [Pseudomonadota]
MMPMFFKILGIVALILLILIIVFGPNFKAKELEPNEEQEDSGNEECASDFDGNVSPKRILTDSEAYNLERIINNMPEGLLICPQVSFNAFINCKITKLRNQFNRKSVDYLIVDHDFNPLLVVEIDDDSHTSKKVRMRDLKRDEIAAAAGIPTLRITNKTPTESLENLIRTHIREAA